VLVYTIEHRAVKTIILLLHNECSNYPR